MNRIRKTKNEVKNLQDVRTECECHTKFHCVRTKLCIHDLRPYHYSASVIGISNIQPSRFAKSIIQSISTQDVETNTFASYPKPTTVLSKLFNEMSIGHDTPLESRKPS